MKESYKVSNISTILLAISAGIMLLGFILPTIESSEMLSMIGGILRAIAGAGIGFAMTYEVIYIAKTNIELPNILKGLLYCVGTIDGFTFVISLQEVIELEIAALWVIIRGILFLNFLVFSCALMFVSVKSKK